MRVLSFYGISDKYIKVISATYKNSIATAKVGNEVSSGIRIETGVNQDCLPSPFKEIILMTWSQATWLRLWESMESNGKINIS